MLTKRIETIASFEQEIFRDIKWEYWIRKFSILTYYTSGVFKIDVNIDEEKDELDRDIVGHDVYGAARHLHRPDMDFHRYTRYDELTDEEKKYVNRIGFRSFLNLLNPLIIGKTGFNLTPTTRINAGLGYTMSPFGDFIDETVWLKHKNLHFSLYARQFQNKDYWFPGFGLGVHNYPILPQLSASLIGHVWQQPKDFDFNAVDSFSGGAIDVDVRYFFLVKRDTWLDAFSIDVGFIYKTKGFLPEEPYLDDYYGFRIGTTVRL